jgi:acyl carrier protein phosphodiesterase
MELEKAAEVDAISARMHLSTSKLKEAEAANMELQSRVVTLQERVDSAEAQYRTVLESLARSREELDHLQTFTAQLTHEKQQLEVFFFNSSFYPFLQCQSESQYCIDGWQ